MFSQNEQLKELTMSVKCEEKRNNFMSNTNRKNSNCQLLGVIVCWGGISQSNELMKHGRIQNSY